MVVYFLYKRCKFPSLFEHGIELVEDNLNLEKKVYFHAQLLVVLHCTGTPMKELRGVTCHMGSHSVTCHPTQVNAPHLTPARKAMVLDLPTPEGWKAELS